MKVKVLTDFRKDFWNIGDTVELEGEELERQLQLGNVESLEEIPIVVNEEIKKVREEKRKRVFKKKK